MHDPCSVAFDIKYPWWNHRPWPKGVRHFEDISVPAQRKYSPHFKHGYRDTLVTIWHKDPERDGSDDSCGYCFPKLNERQRERLKNLAWSESNYPYFLRCKSKEWNGTRHEAEVLYRGLVLLVADVIDIPMTFDEAARIASRAIHHADCVDPAGSFCFLAGYHSNLMEGQSEHSPEDDRYWRRERFVGIASGVARSLLKDRRRWWRHPKRHIHHWRIQIHPLQKLRRWLFTRCATCGHRLGWNESAHSTWDGGTVWCNRCNQTVAAKASEAAMVGK